MTERDENNNGTLRFSSRKLVAIAAVVAVALTMSGTVGMLVANWSEIRVTAGENRRSIEQDRQQNNRRFERIDDKLDNLQEGVTRANASLEQIKNRHEK